MHVGETSRALCRGGGGAFHLGWGSFGQLLSSPCGGARGVRAVWSNTALLSQGGPCVAPRPSPVRDCLTAAGRVLPGPAGAAACRPVQIWTLLRLNRGEGRAPRPGPGSGEAARRTADHAS